MGPHLAALFGCQPDRSGSAGISLILGAFPGYFPLPIFRRRIVPNSVAKETPDNVLNPIVSLGDVAARCETHGSQVFAPSLADASMAVARVPRFVIICVPVMRDEVTSAEGTAGRLIRPRPC